MKFVFRGHPWTWWGKSFTHTPDSTGQGTRDFLTRKRNILSRQVFYSPGFIFYKHCYSNNNLEQKVYKAKLKITLWNADRPKVTHLTVNNVKLKKQHSCIFSGLWSTYCDLSFSLLMDAWSISNMYLGNPSTPTWAKMIWLFRANTR